MISLFEYALKTFLFVGIIFYCPVPLGVSDAIEFGYLSQELFFRYGTALLFFISMMITPIRTLKMNSLPIFGIYLLLLSVLFGFHATSRHCLLNIFFWILLYKVIYENFDFTRIKSYAWWLGWVLLLNLVWCVLQIYGKDLLFIRIDSDIAGAADKIAGMMKLKVFLGILGAILAPFIAVYAPVFLLCVAPLLYFGMSSASAAAVAVSSVLMAWLFLNKKYAFLVSALALLVGIAFVVFYDMPTGQFGERIKVWQATLSMTLRNSPIVGMGLGAFRETNFQTMQVNTPEKLQWIWAHNEFIQAFFEMGAIGMAIVFSFIRQRQKDFESLGKDSILRVVYCVCISILIISFFHFPFHLGRFTHLIAFFFAIYHARVGDLKNA